MIPFFQLKVALLEIEGKSNNEFCLARIESPPVLRFQLNSLAQNNFKFSPLSILNQPAGIDCWKIFHFALF